MVVCILNKVSHWASIAAVSRGLYYFHMSYIERLSQQNESVLDNLERNSSSESAPRSVSTLLLQILFLSQHSKDTVYNTLAHNIDGKVLLIWAMIEGCQRWWMMSEVNGQTGSSVSPFICLQNSCCAFCQRAVDASVRWGDVMWTLPVPSTLLQARRASSAATAAHSSSVCSADVPHTTAAVVV